MDNWLPAGPNWGILMPHNDSQQFNFKRLMCSASSSVISAGCHHAWDDDSRWTLRSPWWRRNGIGFESVRVCSLSSL